MKKKNIAVVGGGVFGTTISWKLAEMGQQVDLFEKNEDIFMSASGINQYRIHRGYHYPRSLETVLTCIEGEKQFSTTYPEAVIDSTNNYYCISKEKSLTSGHEFEKLCKRNNLNFRTLFPNEVNKDNISNSYLVDESLFDPMKLKESIYKKLKIHNVNLCLNTIASRKMLNEYETVVIATYSNNNFFLKKNDLSKKIFQFELCEKIVVKLPDQFKNLSVVIIDGPFMCIDPYGDTGYHVMGNVVHAIHDSKIGSSYDIPKNFLNIVNNGIIKKPEITNYNKFISSAAEYFNFLDEAKYIGSMYTTRVVYPYRDHDDARPTVVENIDNKYISVFSGKIPTCINAANEVLKIVKLKNI